MPANVLLDPEGVPKVADFVRTTHRQQRTYPFRGGDRNAHRGDLNWSVPIPGDTLAKGEHTLEVRLIDADNAEGTDRITFACDLSGGYNPYSMVEPIVRETKFC